ncbi:hypothetical protein EDC04DRAFT_2605940 [Pisolithus marmoratus]|nr:hypothetical protein EDC04DRAFT_2605940 [Pisolithus marmoratus]
MSTGDEYNLDWSSEDEQALLNYVDGPPEQHPYTCGWAAGGVLCNDVLFPKQFSAHLKEHGVRGNDKMRCCWTCARWLVGQASNSRYPSSMPALIFWPSTYITVGTFSGQTPRSINYQRQNADLQQLRIKSSALRQQLRSPDVIMQELAAARVVLAVVEKQDQELLDNVTASVCGCSSSKGRDRVTHETIAQITHWLLFQ